MRKVTQYLMLVLFIAVSVLSVSCQKDDMESIVLKRSGSLTVTILNGEAPVANTKVRFFNEDTGNEIDVYITDEKGRIDFGQLNEGSYAVEVEVESPYTELKQEIQIISGEHTKRTIQIGEYVGTFTIELLDEETGEVVKEDLGLGVALVPYNNALERTKTDEEVIALATTIAYFGEAGELTLSLPVANYVLFAVRGDSILYDISNFDLERLEEEYENFAVNVAREKIISKASWSVAEVSDDMGEAIADFPVSSIKFKSGNRFEMELESELVISGYYDRDGDGDLYFGDYGSADPNLDFYLDGTSLNFDEEGNLILVLDDFSIYDETEGSYIVDLNDISIVLE